MFRTILFTGLLAVTSTCATVAKATYVGNPITNRGGGDGTVTPPLVILGEFNETAPGPTSATTFLTSGTITDVQLYSYLAGQTFTVYTISAAGTSAGGNQQFKFLSGNTFTTTGVGPETFPMSVPVAAGNLLAFWGIGPGYSLSGSDAAYQDSQSTSPKTYVATAPVVGTTYSFATGPSGNYQYLSPIGGDQQDARTYSIGVDISTPEPVAVSVLSLGAITLVRRRRRA